MTKDKALKLALEIALDKEYQLRKTGQSHMIEPVITAIKEALAPTSTQCEVQPEQEPVEWPCVIETADFEEDTVTLKMQTSDYKVSAGKHWLSTTPPKEQQSCDKRPWAGLTDEPTYTEQQIANACWAAEISDSKCESLLIALQEAAPNIGVKP